MDEDRLFLTSLGRVSVGGAVPISPAFFMPSPSHPRRSDYPLEHSKTLPKNNTCFLRKVSITFAPDMANRKKASQEKRTVKMMVPTTQQERELFKRVAEAHHTTFSEFVRRVLYREAKFVKVA